MAHRSSWSGEKTTRRVLLGQLFGLLALGLADSALLASAQASQASTPVGHAAAEAGEPGGIQGEVHPFQLYTEDDLLFLTHMIMHHQQALDMAALVSSRSHRDEFVRYARYLDGAQRAEIDQMQALLRMASDRGLRAPHHDMTGDPPMNGMLSKAQMAALTAAKGAEFERLWLQGMIYHHEGALDMALAQQQRDFQTGRRPYGIDVMLDDLLVVQRAEITKMKNWLGEWKL